MALHSPARRAPYATSGFANAFSDHQDELVKPTSKPPQLQKQGSKLGRFLSHVHERLVMRMVCCAPASVVLEVEFEDEDFCRPENTEINKIGTSLLLKKQKSAKSASVVPVFKHSKRESDRDIPTNEELEKLPIDLSFVLNDAEDDVTYTNNAPQSPVPPPTPRHAALMRREKQLSALRLQQSARLIQRRWRQFATDDASATDVEDDGDKTDLETDTEQSNSRSTKTRRRRIRKHRGRKKKRSN